MTITDEQLDTVVRAWNQYAAGRPRLLKPSDVLKKRDLNMYRGGGVTTGRELAQRLVADRAVASLEMTMGHLYERLLEALGPVKIGRLEKKQAGFRGIDFRQLTPMELRLVNLKAGLSTSNADISASTIRNLTDARDYWEAHPEPDDNPLQQAVRDVVMVRAVARGTARDSVTAGGVRWLVGDAMWEYFGGGPGLLGRLGDALGRNPIDPAAYKASVDAAIERLHGYLKLDALVTADDQVRWGELAKRYP